MTVCAKIFASAEAVAQHEKSAHGVFQGSKLKPDWHQDREGAKRGSSSASGVEVGEQVLLSCPSLATGTDELTHRLAGTGNDDAGTLADAGGPDTSERVASRDHLQLIRRWRCAFCVSRCRYVCRASSAFSLL